MKGESLLGTQVRSFMRHSSRMLISVLDHSASPLSNCQPVGATWLDWDVAWYIVTGVVWVCHLRVV